MKTPILFLDIDGVLNSSAWYMTRQKRSPRTIWEFDPEAIKKLNGLMEAAPDAEIVISSTWRRLYGFSELKSILTNVGFKWSQRIIDVTPDLTTKEHGPLWVAKQRGDEIAMWRDENDHEGPFAVLDDENDMDAVRANFVRTTWRSGIEAEHVEQAIALLQG